MTTYIPGSDHNDFACPIESDLPLMPKDSLGTVQEGNSLVQDDVEIENTEAVLCRLALALAPAPLLPHLLNLALLGTSGSLAQAVEEFPARATVAEALSLRNGRR